jgi:hypothetical protein
LSGGVENRDVVEEGSQERGEETSTEQSAGRGSRLVEVVKFPRRGEEVSLTNLCPKTCSKRFEPTRIKGGFEAARSIAEAQTDQESNPLSLHNSPYR